MNEIQESFFKQLNAMDTHYFNETKPKEITSAYFDKLESYIKNYPQIVDRVYYSFETNCYHLFLKGVIDEDICN